MKALSWSLLMNGKVMRILVVLALVAFWSACSEDGEPNVTTGGSDKRKTEAFDAPAITCESATQTSITVRVTAGQTGAPAGFSLQWTTKATLDANNGIWPAESSGLLCSAGFSGNANGHVFNLDGGAYSTLTIGDILFDTPGASSSCVAELACSTQYVFRAFAHATSTMYKSTWSANQTCTTSVCEEDCVSGQGYWKNTSDPWPVEELMLGNVMYSKEQLLSIFTTPVAGNGLISLAHQLIAAKLNVANGAVPTAAIAQNIADADAMIGDLVVPPIGAGSLAPGDTSSLVNALEAFNNPPAGVSYCQ